MSSKFEWNKQGLRDFEAHAQQVANQIGGELDAKMRAWSAENAGKPHAEVADALVAFWARATNGDPLTPEQVTTVSERVSEGGVFYIANSSLMVSDPGEDV